jgi:hypothetical protein
VQVRALQRRLYQLEGDSDGEAAGEESSSAVDGELCLEADLLRLLAHNRKAADEMQQYGQVRIGRGMLHSVWCLAAKWNPHSNAARMDCTLPCSGCCLRGS